MAEYLVDAKARVFAWLYKVKFDLEGCDISHLIP